MLILHHVTRILAVLSFTLMLVGFPAAFYPGAASAESKPVKLTFGWYYGATTPESLALERYARAVEKRAKNKVSITCYPGGQLATAGGTYDALAKGILDIGSSCQAYTPGRFLWTQTLEMPYGFTTSLMASRISWKMIQKYCLDEYQGVKLLYIWSTPATQIHTIKGKPVRSLKDAEGVQIRCPSGTAPVIKALGFTPVAMPITEAYEALEKGIVDGTSLPYFTMMTWKFGEQTKFSTEANINITLFFVAMNLRTWKSLPPDIQKAFVAESYPGLEDVARSWDSLSDKAVDWMKGLGNEIIKLSPQELSRWEARYPAVREAWIKDMEAKGKAVRPMVKETLELVKNYK